MFETIAIGNVSLFLYIIPCLLLALWFVWRSMHHTVILKISLTLTYTLLFITLFSILANVSIEAYVPQNEQATLTVLIDESTSMTYHNLSVEELIDSIPLKTTTKVIASGTSSPLTTKISGSLYPKGQFLLLSDGFATDEPDFTQVVQTANSMNATIHTLNLDAFKNDASVTLFGPPKTFVGTTNTYVARINGNDKLPGTLRVYLDGEEKYTTTDLGIDHPITFTFSDEMTHTISAELEIDDLVAKNNDYYMTTRIIPKPKVLYVGENTQLETFAKDIFDVTTVTTIPDDLESFSSIIMGNARLTNIDATPIEAFVSEGGGLTVFGGNDAYDFGAYDAHNLATLLPVEKGRGGGKQKAIIVIALDISASTEALFSEVSNNKAIEIQKAIAYNIVEQLGDDNVVGIIAFNTEAFVVSELVPLSISRKTVLDKITRIQMQGNTRINIGLGAAYELLKNEVGTSAIVLITDGHYGGDSDGPKTRSVAKQLLKDNIKLFPIGVGSQINEGFLRQLALDTEGIFLKPDEADRLAIQFGKVHESTQQKPTYSFIMTDTNHPITFGLEHPRTQLNNINQVIPKAGATTLVKTDKGDPALTTWNYGLGRVASWTAFEGVSNYKNFLGSDSYLFGRILTWGAGDPELKNPPLFVIDDTILGKKATVTANSVSLESLATQLETTTEDLAKLSLEKIDETIFRGHLRSHVVGFTTKYGQTFATNYAPELTHIGQSDSIKNIAKLTNGNHLELADLATLDLTIADSTKKIKTQKSIQRELTLFALLMLIIHIVIGKKSKKNKRGKTKK